MYTDKPIGLSVGLYIIWSLVNSMYPCSVCCGVLTDLGHCWTAGRRVNDTNDPSSFIWSVHTAESYVQLPLNFNSFRLHEPNNAYGGEFCILLDQHVNYLWVDHYCGYARNSVCEIDIA